MGSTDGIVVRALQWGLAWCHMWIEFVVGSLLAPKVFLGFSFPYKTSTNYNLNGTEDYFFRMGM